MEPTDSTAGATPTRRLSPWGGPHRDGAVTPPGAPLLWLWATAMTAPVALGGTLAKIAKALALQQIPTTQAAGSDLDALALARLVAVEALWWLAVAATVAALLAWGRGAGGRRWRAVTSVAAASLGLALLGVTATIEHGFFAATGSLLDAAMARYAAANFAMLQAVLASELRAWHVAAWLGVAAAPALPWALPAARAWLAARTSAAGAFTQGALAATVALAALASLPAATATLGAGLPGTYGPLAAAPAWRLAREWAQSAGVDSVAPAGADRPAAPLVVARTARARDWNVVIVALESVRATATTPYTPALATTPFLAAVAERGLRAERAYTTVPHTTKSLVPIHCGYWPKVAPGYDEAYRGALPTECLAATLARLGWRTGYFQASEDRFEKNAELIANFGYQDALALEELEAQGLDKTFERIGYFGLEDRAVVGPMLRWIDQQRGRPFLLGMITSASHHPYDLPRSWRPRSFDADGKRNKYFNAIAVADAALAELYAGIRARGLADKTIFVYVGDHGEGFGEHGLQQHDEVMFDEGVRIPLVIEAPGLAPRVVSGLRQNVDIVPTILELLGLAPLAGQLDGHSLLSSSGHRQLPLACWHKDRCLAVIAATGQELRKTIWHHDRRPAQVFDLRQDPGESRDLVAAGSVRPSDVTASVDWLKSWRAATWRRHQRQAERRARALVDRRAPDGDQGLDLRFVADGVERVRLRGIHWEATTATPGGDAHVRLLWEVLAPMPPGWTPFLHGRSRGELRLRAGWTPAEGAHAVEAWQPGEFVSDRVHVRPDHGMPGGPLEVLLGFWRPDDGRRMEVVGGGAPRTGDGRVILGTLWIDRGALPALAPPHRQLAAATLPGLWRPRPGLAPPPDLAAADGGATWTQPASALPIATTAVGAPPLDHGEVEVVRIGHGSVSGVPCRGATLEVAFAVHVLRQPPRYSHLFVHLRGPHGRHRNLDFVPLDGRLPVDDWRAGDRFLAARTFTVPADWPPGRSTVQVGLHGPNVVGAQGRLPVRPPGPAPGAWAVAALDVPPGQPCPPAH